MIHIYYVSLGVVFALFLAQNFKTKVLTAHKNLLLECLVFQRNVIEYFPKLRLKTENLTAEATLRRYKETFAQDF